MFNECSATLSNFYCFCALPITRGKSRSFSATSHVVCDCVRDVATKIIIISLYILEEPTVERIRGDAEDNRIRQRVERDFLADSDGLSLKRVGIDSVVEPVRHCSRCVDVVYTNSVARQHVRALPMKIFDVDLKHNVY